MLLIIRSSHGSPRIYGTLLFPLAVVGRSIRDYVFGAVFGTLVGQVSSGRKANKSRLCSLRWWSSSNGIWLNSLPTTYQYSSTERVGTLPLTFWTNNQPSTLLCTLIDRLDNVDQFLLVLQDPIELVVVPSPEVAHL